ncbi:MAG: hypothetical protein AB9866_15180 [Syntrophobacteraceae bacterium]
MNELENVSSELGRAIDQVTKQIADLDLKHVLQLYDNIQIEFLPRVYDNHDAAVEIKRRVAESKFYLVCEYDCPLEDVILFYGNLCKLGFADLEREATVGIILANYCLRNKHMERGTETLKHLHTKLNDFLANNDSELYHHLTKLVEDILAKMGQAS